MIKLIATDIDGTLLADGTLEINPEYYDVIKELRSRGVRVIAASGRQRSSIEKVFAPIVDEISFISENGSWAPAAARIMQGMFEKSKNITWLENNVKITSSLSEANEAEIEAMAEELCK